MSPPAFDDGSTAGERTLPNGSPGLSGRFDGRHVLVPLLTAEVPAVTDQVRVASALSRVSGAAISVVNPVSAPAQTPLTLGTDVPRDEDEELLEWVLDRTVDSTARVDGGFSFARDVVRGILRAVRSRNVDTLVLPGKSGSGWIRKGLVERIAVHADCDVVVVNGQAGYDQVASVLLPVAGGPNTGLIADLARTIAADCDAWIDVLHVVDDGASDRARAAAGELVEDVSHRIARPGTTTTWVLEADEPAPTIIEQSQYYGLTVIGAPTKGRLRRFLYGSTSRTVRADARSVVLSGRNNSSRPADGQ